MVSLLIVFHHQHLDDLLLIVGGGNKGNRDRVGEDGTSISPQVGKRTVSVCVAQSSALNYGLHAYLLSTRDEIKKRRKKLTPRQLRHPKR